MVRKKLKIEIIIPKFYNDGKKIDPAIHLKTNDDLSKQFGSFIEDPSSQLGEWKDPTTGIKYKDTNFIYWILCEHDNKHLNFLKKFKKKLEKRYKQQKILIYYSIVYEMN